MGVPKVAHSMVSQVNPVPSTSTVVPPEAELYRPVPPPGFRVVFALRDVEGLSTEETADALGLSIPAVKSRLLRARLQLRERLSRYFKRRESKKAQGGEK